MNVVKLDQTGGFPLETETLAHMQDAYGIFQALGNIVGEKSIIKGCVVAGVNVSDGVVYLNGELLQFVGGAIQATVVVIETAVSGEFEDGLVKPIYYTRYATFGAGVGAVNWVDFKRGFQTKDILEALALKVDTSVVTPLSVAVDGMIIKLNTIDEYAEKNVQSDLNQTDNTKDDFIKGQEKLIKYLAKGTYIIGDNASTDSIRTVTFPTVGTTNYMVIGSMVSLGSNYNEDDDVIWMVREKNTTSFKITMREVSSHRQNLKFDYILIPL